MTQVALYLAAPPESQYRIDQLHGLLDDQERIRAARFKHDEDRRTFITAHALARLTLSAHTPSVAPCEWHFQKGQWGRPHPTNAEIGDLQVNLSHTSGMAAAVVSRGTDVGVDVEWARPDDWIFETVDTVFSTDEIASLLRLTETERRERFFLYWTLKESYIKARGMGVSLPLTKISFAPSPSSRDIVLELDPSIKDRAGEWRFETFRPGPEIHGAVAARTPAIELDVTWPTVH